LFRYRDIAEMLSSFRCVSAPWSNVPILFISGFGFGRGKNVGKTTRKERLPGFSLPPACIRQARVTARTADTRRNLSITSLHFPSLRSISATSRVSRALSQSFLRGQFLIVLAGKKTECSVFCRVRVFAPFFAARIQNGSCRPAGASRSRKNSSWLQQAPAFSGFAIDCSDAVIYEIERIKKRQRTKKPRQKERLSRFFHVFFFFYFFCLFFYSFLKKSEKRKE
jgi:hypothetical protein